MKFFVRATALATMAAGVLTLTLAAGSASAADVEFKWRYFGVSIPSNPYAVRVIAGLNAIKERSGGRIQIDYVPFGETPYKGSEAPKLMRDGLGEMTEWLIAYSTSSYPLLSAAELPLLPPSRPDTEALITAAEKAWASPAVASRLNEILAEHKARPIASFYWPPQNFWFKSAVQTPKDFKGLKIREYSAEGITFLKALDASPVNMTAPEVYTSLQRGMLDGVITGSHAMVGAKWGEVLRAGYLTNGKTARSLMLISERRFAELPADLQKIVLEEGDKISQVLRDFLIASEAGRLKELKETYGFTLVDATPEDYATLRKIAVDVVWPGWIERTGTGAAEVLNSVLAAMDAKETY